MAVLLSPTMRRLAGSFVLVTIAGCATAEPDEPSAPLVLETEPGDIAGTSRPPPPYRESVARHPVRITGYRVVRVAPHAERDHGSRVEADHSAAVDLFAERWPGQAHDPILQVGEQLFRDYSFPEPGVLRFVVTDIDSLTVGARVVLSIGDHSITVTDALQGTP